MNHLGEGVCHEAKHRCRYTLQYDNRIYTCKVRTVAHHLVLILLSIQMTVCFSCSMTDEYKYMLWCISLGLL